jgi:hypothetical protein
MVPVPDSEKPHPGTPGMLAVPVAVIGTELPLICPCAVPLIVMLPAHSMKKLPDTLVSV